VSGKGKGAVMKCLECESILPFFAYATAEKKQACPACKSNLVPTEKSMTEIKLVTGTFSFLAAIPLGAFTIFLWFDEQPWFALYFLVFGSGSVIAAVSIYSRFRIRFRQAWLAPSSGS